MVKGSNCELSDDGLSLNNERFARGRNMRPDCAKPQENIKVVSLKTEPIKKHLPRNIKGVEAINYR